MTGMNRHRNEPQGSGVWPSAAATEDTLTVQVIGENQAVMLARYSIFAIVMWMPWTVSLHPQAEAELKRLPTAERVAVLNAAQKLEALGPDLGYPHSSAVRDADRLRELRPRAGRSPWRGFYRRFGDVFVLAAVGPEAEVDPRGFKRAVVAAEERLEEVEGE